MATETFPGASPALAPAAKRGRSSALKITLEALPVMVLSLLGFLLSGYELDNMARWTPFVKVDKLLILVPIIMNLKGNLEVNLSLRMSTAANIGELDNRRTRRALVTGNLALLQVQGLLVSSLAGALSFALGQYRSGAVSRAAQPTQPRGPVRVPSHAEDGGARMRNGYFEFALVLACAMLSTSVSSAVQGSFLCALVIWACRTGRDPDNTVVPLASSLGDIVTLTVLGLLAALLVRFQKTWLATAIFIALMGACVAFVIATLRNAYVRELLGLGWTPLLLAAVISSWAGLLLDQNAAQYTGIALLSPGMAGLPGVSASVLVSCTTTALHSGRVSAPTRPTNAGSGYMPITDSAAPPADGEGHPTDAALAPPSGRWHWIASVRLSSPADGWTVPLTLLMNSITVQGSFLLLLHISGRLLVSWLFAALYMALSLVLTVFALVFAHWLTYFLWYWDYDPDMSCMPFVTATVDVVAQVLLLAMFSCADALGESVKGA
ncbi:hypothetical protein MSPP1_002067 [Malassezia sp. CBS 17886]|nr:hypothetical protein MSPP1_002067 [Malassezia sp. CBS 17886]